MPGRSDRLRLGNRITSGATIFALSVSRTGCLLSRHPAVTVSERLLADRTADRTLLGRGTGCRAYIPCVLARRRDVTAAVGRVGQIAATALNLVFSAGPAGRRRYRCRDIVMPECRLADRAANRTLLRRGAGRGAYIPLMPGRRDLLRLGNSITSGATISPRPVRSTSSLLRRHPAVIMPERGDLSAAVRRSGITLGTPDLIIARRGTGGLLRRHRRISVIACLAQHNTVSSDGGRCGK